MLHIISLKATMADRNYTCSPHNGPWMDALTATGSTVALSGRISCLDTAMVMEVDDHN